MEIDLCRTGLCAFVWEESFLNTFDTLWGECVKTVAGCGSSRVASSRTKKVSIGPFPLTSIFPRAYKNRPPPSFLRILADSLEQCIIPGSECDSILDAVLTVSPNKQYRGLLEPTTLATTGPEWNPTRRFNLPRLWSSSSTQVCCEALTASKAKRATRWTWSGWYCVHNNKYWWDFLLFVHGFQFLPPSYLNEICYTHPAVREWDGLVRRSEYKPPLGGPALKTYLSPMVSTLKTSW